MARGGIKPWQLFAALAIFAIIAFAFFTPAGTSLSGLGSGPSTPPSGTSPGVVTKPMLITCIDPLAGSNCGAVTIAVYQGSSPNLLETQSASASGVATTGNSYRSGTPLTLKISGNSKVTEYVPVTVPTAYVTDTDITFTVYAVTLGTWTQTLTGNNGATTFVSGSQYGLSTYSGNQVTITDSLTSSTANAGYKSSYDITNLLNQYWVLQVDDGAGASSSTVYATITGLAHTYKLGNTNYYWDVCPDGLSGSGVGTQYNIQSNSQSAGSADSVCAGSLSVHTIGNQVFGGGVTLSLTVAVGSLATNTVETISFKMEYYADPAYFVANGNLGPNAAQSGSTFTLKFNK